MTLRSLNLPASTVLLLALTGCSVTGGAESSDSSGLDAEGKAVMIEVCDGYDNDHDGLIDEDYDVDDDGIADCFDTEVCDGADNDGDGLVDEGFDADDDGVADCDDEEECDGADNDGDGQVDEGFDADDDGIADCYDVEECDGVDNDGDGSVDEDFDADDDGVADCYDEEECDGVDNDGDGLVDEGFDADDDGISDCDDTEECDGEDNDGDGAVDEGFDADDDGIADCEDVEADCYDVEECDGVDNDGDGAADEGFDSDADGVADCYDVEECDGVDNDGDGSTDEGFDGDGDGVADCYDVEQCDGVDNDGDGAVDEGFDSDADGVADCDDTEECDGVDNDGDGFVDEGFDSDADGTADCFDEETCFDGVDNDGDGSADEDCPEDCPDEPADECLSLYEAYSRGWLTFGTDGTGSGVTVTNSGDEPVCLDEEVLSSSPGSQGQAFGSDIVEDAVELAPGATVTLYYGSWTTENGVYEGYLGEYAWWCIEEGQNVAGGITFDFYGEIIPEDLWYYISESTDEDGDGVEDHVDWAGNEGVQTQANIWDYQDSHTILTVGQWAESDGASVEVTLISRNIGADAGSGLVCGNVPSGWEVASSSDGATESDGAICWDVTLDGYVLGSTHQDDTTVDSETFTYTIVRTTGADDPEVYIDSASVEYNDGDSDEVSTSLPFIVYEYDGNGDGVVECDTE